jgi:hypothetical protein
MSAELMSAGQNLATSAGAGDLFLCGWRVRTALPLPELAPWNRDAREPDLRISTGEVPRRLDDAQEVSPLLQVNPQGEARLCIDGVATYWLRSAGEIVIQPQLAADAPDIRTFLFGTVLGLLIHRRGLFPLHASCVRIGEEAIAICGPSGAGKSTFAAALSRRGHKLLADDICVIDTADAEDLLVRPAFPRVKLWKDSLDAMGIAAEGLAANRRGQRKYYLCFDETAAFETRPVPLKAIYLLSPSRLTLPTHGEIRDLPAMAGVMALHQQIYRKRTAAIWGLEPGLFRTVGRIAAAARIHQLTRSGDLAELDRMVRRIEAHAAS